MRFWLLVCVLLAGCGKGFSERGDRTAGEYRWLLRYDVKTLDPAAINDWTTGEVLHYLYPTAGEVCDIEPSADFKTFTLKVKELDFSDKVGHGCHARAHVRATSPCTCLASPTSSPKHMLP